MTAATHVGRHAIGSPEPAGTSRRTVILRVVVLVVGLLLVAFYLAPRIYNLVATPYRLDAAVVSAGRYNPALDHIVDHEKVTLAAFDALDSLNKSLADVQATDASVDSELRTLIGQINTDLIPTLHSARGDVADLVTSLNGLTGRIATLEAPVAGASRAVTADRATLAGILDDARSTAAKVHQARLSAETGAGDLSGQGGR